MGEESKYSPGLAAMDMESLEGAAKAAQSLTDRRFQAFEGDIEIIINMGMFDEDNVQLVKELKVGVGDTLTRYEEVLSRLEAIYSVKPDKFEDQIKNMNSGVLELKLQKMAFADEFSKSELARLRRTCLQSASKGSFNQISKKR